MIIAIDFDGTCVAHDFPNIGADIGSAKHLRELIRRGHKLILYTMRSDITHVTSNDPNIHKETGNYLSQAVQWFKDNNIELYGTNKNPEQNSWTTSPKPYADIYIDDKAVWAPLIENHNISKHPFINWELVMEFIKLQED